MTQGAVVAAAELPGSAYDRPAPVDRSREADLLLPVHLLQRPTDDNGRWVCCSSSASGRSTCTCWSRTRPWRVESTPRPTSTCTSRCCSPVRSWRHWGWSADADRDGRWEAWCP